MSGSQAAYPSHIMPISGHPQSTRRNPPKNATLPLMFELPLPPVLVKNLIVREKPTVVDRPAKKRIWNQTKPVKHGTAWSGQRREANDDAYDDVLTRLSVSLHSYGYGYNKQERERERERDRDRDEEKTITRLKRGGWVPRKSIDTLAEQPSLL